MSRMPGQAARGAAWLLHRAGRLLLLLAVLTGIGLAVLSWRLSAGSISLDWAAKPLERALNADGGPTRLSIGHAALAWEGFSHGVDRPLDLRLRDVLVRDASGPIVMDVPRAQLSLSLRGLLLGRVLPRAIAIEHPRLRVFRAADGTLSLDAGTRIDSGDKPAPTPGALQALLADVATPAQNDRTAARISTRFGQMLRLQVSDAAITIIDQQLGATWRIPAANVDLRRRPEGGVTGIAYVRLVLGEQETSLTLAATLGAAAAVTRLGVDLAPFDPAGLARTAPVLAPLAAVEAPVGLHLDLDLGPHLRLRHARVAATLGAGRLHIHASAVPVLDGALLAEGDLQDLTIQRLMLRAPGGTADAAPTTLAAHATLRRNDAGLRGDIALDLDHVAAADLARLWPEGVGGPGARPWITQNVTAGTLRDGHVELALAAPPDLSDVTVSRARAALTGEDLTIRWLAPIPPVEHVRAQLTLSDADRLDIETHGGRQGSGSLILPEGHVAITGLTAKDQVAQIDGQIAGPVADAVALLRQPRLHLFDRHKVDLRDPSGQAAMGLSVRLPLESSVTMDSIAIHAQGRLSQLHLSDVVAGRPLDDGQIDLDVTNDGMRAKGTARLGGILAAVSGLVDFRTGLPSDIVERVEARADPDAPQLAAAGLDVGAVVTAGTIALHAGWAARRDGRAEVTAHADLTDAALTVAALRWSKAGGAAASADAHLLLDHDRLVGIDQLALQGEALSVRGTAAIEAGEPRIVLLDPIVIGRTRARGQISLPAVAGEPYTVALSGAVLDLSGRMSHTGARPASPKPEPAGPHLILDARFEHALMGGGETLSGLTAHVERNAGAWQRVALDASTGTAKAIHLSIAPEGTPSGAVRRLSATAADAGVLLRAVDITAVIQGGRLTVTGSYDDTVAEQPLTGSADVQDFRVAKAPGLAKALQAMTLYGLVDALSGPGLGFARLIAPFRLTDEVLDLHDARAFSSSLGLTAKGRIALAGQTADLQGTIVPAYFFNSLLGRIPLVGRLFSPEEGGGLFAASYAIRGPLDDPQVSVNPLAALTPGVLRGLFGVFDLDGRR